MTSQRTPSFLCVNSRRVPSPSSAALHCPFLRLRFGSGFVYAPVQTEAMELIARFPEALWDVLLFSLCGALGQLVIFYNIREFGSVASTTITVTRWVFRVCRC